ncbi:hypothetical protein QZH41_010894, partial [Actinostola sp. cb2023]
TTLRKRNLYTGATASVEEDDYSDDESSSKSSTSSDDNCSNFSDELEDLPESNTWR